MFYRDLGVHLREIRRNRGLTQEALAGLSNVSRPTIHRVENGQQKAHEGTLQKLSRALDVDPEDIDPERYYHLRRLHRDYYMDDGYGMDDDYGNIGVKLTDSLVKRYMPTVRKSAKKYALNGADVDDLESAGLMGLYEAAQKFDKTKGVLDYWMKFIATNRVRDEARRLYKNHPGFGLENQNIEPFTY